MANDVMMQYFEWYLNNEPHLWTLLKEDAQHLKTIGITAVWMPPAFKGIGGQNDVGYGVYDVYDLGEFYQQGTICTKYGTKEEYLSAIETLHQQGIQVYGDIVLNHKMGADATELVKAYEVNQSDKNQIISDEETIEVPTIFTFPHRYQKYSDFTWNWTCFKGIDYDVLSKRHATFLFKDKSWDENVDDENGNFDYLMGADIDLDNKEVIEELQRWGKWYFDFTGIDGVRLDAVKHMSASFYKNWLSYLRNQRNNDFFAVGEYWNGSVDKLIKYLEAVDHSMSLFDVPLHYHFYDASHSQGQYDMRTIFDGTLVSAYPQNAVTFVDNHDTQIGQSLESWVQDWFKPIAYALILLRNEGFPCLFYGDYYGLKGYEFKGIKDDLDLLLKLRKEWAYGQQIDYFDQSAVIGWTRAKGLAVLISIGQQDIKKMYVGKDFAKKYFYDYLGNVEEEIMIDEEGFGIFKVKDGSVSAYIPKIGEL